MEIMKQLAGEIGVLSNKMMSGQGGEWKQMHSDLNVLHQDILQKGAGGGGGGHSRHGSIVKFAEKGAVMSTANIVIKVAHAALMKSGSLPPDAIFQWKRAKTYAEKAKQVANMGKPVGRTAYLFQFGFTVEGREKKLTLRRQSPFLTGIRMLV